MLVKIKTTQMIVTIDGSRNDACINKTDDAYVRCTTTNVDH